MTIDVEQYVRAKLQQLLEGPLQEIMKKELEQEQDIKVYQMKINGIQEKTDLLLQKVSGPAAV